MLVLTRKSGESIVIGEEVVITVLEIRGGQVRLGVEAPREVTIHRSEVHEQVSVEEGAVGGAFDQTGDQA